jgi:hypothetical protein
MKRLALLLAVTVLAFASPARAGELLWGPQAGLSINPTQVVFGFHVVAPLAQSVDFVPSIDLGVGDGAFTIAANGDVHVNIAPESSLRPYVGGGVTIYNVNPNADGADGSTEVGGMLLGGIWLNRDGATSYYLEGRIGLGDVPDFKAVIGLNL